MARTLARLPAFFFLEQKFKQGLPDHTFACSVQLGFKILVFLIAESAADFP